MLLVSCLQLFLMLFKWAIATWLNPKSWFGLLMGKRMGEGKAFFSFILWNWGSSHLVVTRSTHPSLGIVVKRWKIISGVYFLAPLLCSYVYDLGQTFSLHLLKGIIIFYFMAAVKTKLDDTFVLAQFHNVGWLTCWWFQSTIWKLRPQYIKFCILSYKGSASHISWWQRPSWEKFTFLVWRLVSDWAGWQGLHPSSLLP